PLRAVDAGARLWRRRRHVPERAVTLRPGVDEVLLEEVSRAPMCTLWMPCPGTLVVVPNCHAHSSAFSSPFAAYQASRSGSVTVSVSSCTNTDAIASILGLLFGLVD